VKSKFFSNLNKKNFKLEKLKKKKTMENKHMALFYAFVLFASVCTKPTPIDENQESVSEDSGRENSSKL